MRAPASSRAIASAARAGRPSQIPIAAAGEPPAGGDRERELVGVLVGDDDADRAERGGDAGDQQHRDPQQVAEQHLLEASAGGRGRRLCRRRRGRRAARSRAAPRRRRRRRRRRARAHPPARARAGRRTRRGRCGRRRRTAPRSRRASLISRRTAIPLWTVASGRTSSTMRPRCGDEALLLGEHGDLARPLRRGLLVGGPAPVDRLDRALVLEPQPDPRRAGPSRGRRRTRPRRRRGRRAPDRGGASESPGPSSSSPWLPA